MSLSNLQEKPPTFKREHIALQNNTFLRFLIFCGSFFAHLDRIRTQSTKITADPDRQQREKRT
jgi:hypothetical protein